MAITIQFLLGLLMATQICCLQDSEFVLGNGEKFTVHDTSVKFENFFFNHTHEESLVGFKIKGAIGSKVKNLALVLDIVNLINLNDENEPFLTKCDISLRSPNDEFSQEVFRALEDLIYNTTCINANGFTDLAFDTIAGNNEVHLDTITSSLKNVKQITRDIALENDEHQQGVDTLVDMAVDLVKKKFELTDIHINNIVAPMVTVRNLSVGNLTTVTRTRPFEIYRKNDILMVDATFKIRPYLLFTATGSIWKFTTPTMEFNAVAEKIEVRIKLNVDYSVEPCRIKVIDMNFTKEKLAITMMDEGIVAKILNNVLFYLEQLLTPERLLPPIKDELQKLLDREDFRSEAESLRPIFLRV